MNLLRKIEPAPLWEEDPTLWEGSWYGHYHKFVPKKKYKEICDYDGNIIDFYPIMDYDVDVDVDFRESPNDMKNPIPIKIDGIWYWRETN